MQQLSLLGGAPKKIDVPGLVYVDDYIRPDEELALTAAVDAMPWRTEWKRRRQVYGVSYGSAVSPALAAPPFPPWLEALAARIAGDGWLAPPIVNAVINEYEPGQGISAHRDYPTFGPTVVAVSLGSACLLELRKEEASPPLVLDVQPRSLWVLGGEARRSWFHGIAPRLADVVDGTKRPRGRRISITLRTAAR